LKDNQEQRRKQQVHSRMQVLLFRHKELLKKDILKKRALLEKELQIDIQVCIDMSIYAIYNQIMIKHDM
jgi:nucleosome-remodeling factor subunit BPTF